MNYTSAAVRQARVAVITGGEGGIGLETAKAMPAVFYCGREFGKAMLAKSRAI
ncbi:MAG: hypothetical protein JO025_16405 [Verrucomicrobia bacterium]|nr:hypothetical protein [Verrucomicrobiota bacterium]